ncbi:MAG: MarR family transcriptional regulator [Aureliella sp.]
MRPDYRSSLTILRVFKQLESLDIYLLTAPDIDCQMFLAPDYVKAENADGAIKSHGLSDAQFNALRILRGEAKPMRVHQIADRMIFESSDISRLIDRLHSAGLVSRDNCGDDRRVVWISLTEKAKKILTKMDEPLKQVHEGQFADLSDRELASLNQLLFRSRKHVN